MNIYIPIPDSDNYDGFYYLDQEKSHDILSRFLNFSVYQDIEEKSEWIPLPVGIESFDTKRGDFLGVVAWTFACNNRAWKILEPLIGDSVKLLPLQCDEGEFNILKVINIIDCLDRSKADLFIFEETGRVLGIEKYAFKEELIQDQHFFAIPECKFVILVSQKFKDLVEQHQLEGLNFKQVA
ncbi:MAG: hypothetical protein HWQ44_00315 [Nostoc sp. JL34]|uniref:imm11 family protein n=1 Tax=Nostoc sp. JL34 TaxID=2815397 RepID=UPI001D5822F8|nr:DUF1629 domain-containing protein [Nostoc sp. JL34]MBN3881457.1 hypothetical protein [Nostoc sp. JL34]